MDEVRGETLDRQPVAAPAYEPTRPDEQPVGTDPDTVTSDAAILVQRAVVERYPRTYTGVWMSSGATDRATVTVGLSHEEPESDDEILEKLRERIPGDYPLRIERQATPLVELEAAQMRLSHGWDEDGGNEVLAAVGIGRADTNIIVTENRLHVLTAEDVDGSARRGDSSGKSPSQQAAEELATELGVDVEVLEGTASDIEQNASCIDGRFNCRPHMLGGLSLQIVGVGNCTAGASVFGPATGRRFVLTAGHCALAGGGSGTVFNHGGLRYGTAERPLRSGFVDATRVVRESGRGWLNQGEIFAGRDIRRVRSFVRWSDIIVQDRQQLAVSGQTTGASRGHIFSKHAQTGGVSRLIAMSRALGGDVCTNDGDSGAPWFRNDVIFGIHKGSNRGQVPLGCADQQYAAFASSISYVLDELNVELIFG